jgi:hypothetical protein
MSNPISIHGLMVGRVNLTPNECFRGGFFEPVNLVNSYEHEPADAQIRARVAIR